MAKLVGHVLAVVGDTSAINGPTTDTGADGLGQRNPLGVRTFDDVGNEYVYLSGIASTIAGAFVLYGQGATQATLFATVLVINDAAGGAAGKAGLCAVAMAAPIAVTSFGWYQIYGSNIIANVATVGAPTGAAALYRTGTAGRLGTSAVAKDMVFGAFLSGAAVANVGPVALSYPIVEDNSTV